MKIAYTVCSLNRMGQILVLGNSILKHNPEYTYYACLADEINGRIDPSGFAHIKFISLSELNIPDLENFTSQYDAFELSCALKAFYGEYLMKKFQPELLLYFDTDMQVYDNFKVIEDKLQSASILLSPHYISPIPADGKIPMERDVLNSGIYNGGFVGMRNDENAGSFLQWWKERLTDQGYNRVCDGMMVDQLWLNLVPLYFKKVDFLNHPGCNLAYWNMHERKLTVDQGRYSVNGEPLVFFHFSGYRPEQPEKVSVHQNRYDLKQLPALKKIVNEYARELEANNFSKYRPLVCVYDKIKPQKKPSFLKKFLIKMLASAGYKLEKTRKM